MLKRKSKGTSKVLSRRFYFFDPGAVVIVSFNSSIPEDCNALCLALNQMNKFRETER